MATPLKLQLEILATGAGKTVGQIRDIQKAIKDTGAASRSAGAEGAAGASKQSIGLAETAFRFNNVIGALQNLRAAAQPVYDALIASNEKLNAQILSSQTNLASSTRIFQGDQEITDPTAKINATRGAIKQALKEVEIATQELVGVTTSEVNELFQITLTNAGALGNQSKVFPDQIASAAALTKGWAASLKVIGVPLNQARQEINSILKGQIDQNSILAKNLNITNAQVGQWQAQGRLVDELNKRLDVFVAGNAIAARSIDGIGSNIKDLIERIGRNAGEPLLEPIINVLASIEKYLKINEAAITNFFRGLSEGVANGINSLEKFQPTFKFLEESITRLAPIVSTLFKAAIDGFIVLEQINQEVLKPIREDILYVLEGLGKINDLINYDGNADAISALEQYGEQVLKLQDAIGANGTAIRKLQAIEKSGVPLTAEQIQQKKQLLAVSKILTDQAKAEAAEIGKVQANNPAIIEQRNNLIKAAEAQVAASEKNIGANRLEAKSLDVLGTTQEQYAKKVADNQRQIKNEANGQADDFKKAAKEAVDLAKTGVETKQITVEQARVQLKEILNNAKVDLDAQIAAKKAIVELYDGRISKVKELIEVGELQAEMGIAELARIRDDSELEASTRRKAAQQIVGIRKEQIAAETSAIQAQQARIAALQAEQRLGEQATDRETTVLKLAEIDKQAEAQRLLLENATNNSERDKTLAEISKTEADRAKLQAEFDQRERKRLVDFGDQRRLLIKANYDLGVFDQGEYNTRIAQNDLEQLDTQLRQQREAFKLLAANDVDGRNILLSKIAEAESKQVAILRQFDDAEVKRNNDYRDQELKALESYKATKLISEAEFAKFRLQNRLEQSDAEIKLQQRSLERLSKNDIEGRNAIEAKIFDLRTKRIAAFDQLYQAELEQIKIYQTEANQLLQQAEVERTALIQIAANNRSTRIEQTEQARSTAQKKALEGQLALAKDQEARLAALSGRTRSPEAERAYQQEVRAARLNTAQITLKQLEQEGQQIQYLRGLAIKAIDDRVAAQTRAADAQIGKIAQISAAQARATKTAEAAGEREKFNLDRVAKSLELQNNLYQAKLALTKAIQSAEGANGDIEAEKIKSAIELTKQLETENLSEKERLIIQKRLTELIGPNAQSLYQLALRQSELEGQAAQRKQAALLFEQEQARIQLALEQKKNDLTNQRAVLEAKIGELKAKQSLLDAQSALQQERINSQKAIQIAQGDVDKARELAPGQDRDRQLADAQARLALAKESAIANQANAVQQIELAKQQVQFAGENVEQARAQQAQQAEINRLQTATLEIQQKSAIAQVESVESARKYADELARARAEAEKLSTALNNTGTGFAAGTPRRAGGGAVRSGQPTIVGEREQEVFIPGANGVVLNQQQIIANLGLLTKGAGLNLGNSATTVINRTSGGQGAVVQQLQSLQAAIEGRPPAQINPAVTFGSPTSAQSDEYFKMLRSIERGAV
jgi:hypothetical protein